MSESAPAQQKKDGREWTTPEQKAYLESRLPGYSVSRSTDQRANWFDGELAKYFAQFPTLPVTELEKLQHPNWSSILEKQKEERAVSI